MRITVLLFLILLSWETACADGDKSASTPNPEQNLSPDIQRKNYQALLDAMKVFKLSNRWESLEQAPVYIQRNRGAARFLIGWIYSRSNHVYITRDYSELIKNKDRLVETAKRLDRESGELYRTKLQFDVLRFLVELISEGKETFHFSRTQFKDAYYSLAEGRSSLFQVVLPPDYSLKKKYPLIVQVFGSQSLLPTKAVPFIHVRPTGRGVWGYRSMSRYDVMQIISLMKQGYSIDEDRVYMTGTSAGATGMMHAAAYRQQVFAGLVPLVAFGNDLPLENYYNLPIRCEHGVNDWTSSIGNVRVQFQKLDQLGYDAILNEHPTAGHGIRIPPPETLKWLFKLKRNPSPKRIVYTCEHPRDGEAYWLKIESLWDPHQRVRIDAKATDDGLTIQTDNIQQFSLDLKNTPLREGQKLTIDDSLVPYSLTVETGRLTLIQNPTWQTTSSVEKIKTGKRAYGAGAAANLFQGEPLLVVYGTEAGLKEKQFLKQAGTLLARSGGPHFKPATVQFPVRSDANLKEMRLDQFNLLLVGTPENNSYLMKIASKLPFSVDEHLLKISRRKPVSLNGAVLSFLFYNPEYPDRLIYVLSPYLDAAEQTKFLKNPRHFLAGSHGFKMIDQPDLMVRDADLRIRCEMQLEAEWKFRKLQGADQHIPPQFSDRDHLAVAHMKVMQKAANVDFAFWWGPEDKGSFGGYDFNWLPTFDSEFYTRADYAVRQRETECLTATISGEELLDFDRRWISKNELITWPKMKADSIKADRKYRIVIPMDLVVKLGTRKKVLTDVAPGPMILPEQVVQGIFLTPKTQ